MGRERLDSRSHPLPGGIEEGAVRDAGATPQAINLDLDARPRLRAIGRNPCEPDYLADRFAPARARDPAGGQALDDDLRAFGGENVFLHRKAAEPLLLLALREVLERVLADEVVLVELREPRHPGRVEVRLRVGVLPDDDVPLLEPENALRLEAERTRALGHEPAPQILAGGAREVELVPELAGGTRPQT